MECPACGNSNPDAHRFCGSCGARLISGQAALLPATPDSPAIDSGQGNAAHGYTPRHLAERILKNRSALEGERKQVTVLFCDIAGSTPMAERLGPDQMHHVLDAFFTTALDAVHLFEGTVNQFLGDGLMALFGAPMTHEDHARRAVLAALAIRDSVNRSSSEWTGEPAGVQIRVGLNTGFVVVGTIGDNLRMDYTAVGDTTNVAARLQGHAQPGTILIGDEVLRQVRRFVEVRPLGSRLLKGKSEPMMLHEVLREQRPLRNIHALPPSESMFGREEESALIAKALDAILLQHQGAVMTIVGEAGMGKSRLIEEARMLAQNRPLRWIEGNCVSFGKTLSYWPFREALRDLFAVAADDDEASMFANLEIELRNLFGQEADELLPFIARLMSLPLTGEAAQRISALDAVSVGHQIFRWTMRLLERIAVDRPVVLVFEDWQWADGSSAELLQHLQMLSLRAPIMFIVVARPEASGPAASLMDSFESNDALARRHCSIRLTALEPSASSALLGRLLDGGSLPAAVQGDLLQRASGNPFYLEELVRALIATRAIEHAPGSNEWQTTLIYGSLPLPHTIEGVILARIDRLNDDAKQVLKTAAVVGRTFFYRVLQALNAEQANLDADIALLTSAQMIGQLRSLPEFEMMFKHPLIQQAAYGSLLQERKKVLHRRVGQCIEEMFSNRLDGFYSVLAHHYAAAEDWDKAQEYLLKAADQAGSIAADTEAIAHYQAALEALRRSKGAALSALELAELYRKLGQALFQQGKQHESVDCLVRALALIGIRYPSARREVAMATGQEMLRRASSLIRRSLFRRAQVEDLARQRCTVACRTLETLLHIDFLSNPERYLLGALMDFRLSEPIHESALHAVARSGMGMICDVLGGWNIGGRFHGEGVSIAERTGEPIAIGQCCLMQGMHAYGMGNWNDAEAWFKRGADVLYKSGALHYWAECFLFIPWLRRSRGDLSSDAELETARQLALEAGAMHVSAWVTNEAGLALSRKGARAQAIEHFRDASAALESVGDMVFLTIALSEWALCALAQGDEATALSLATRSELLRAKHKVPGLLATTSIMGVAQVYLTLAEGSSGEARNEMLRRAASACRIARRHGRNVRDDRAPDSLRLVGIHLWLLGKTRRAIAVWSAGIELAKTLGAQYVLAQTYLARGMRMCNQDDLEHALALFVRCGAEVDACAVREELAR